MNIPSEKTIYNQIYRHFKGDFYVTIGYSTHTETKDKLIIYYSMSDPKQAWARPATMFFDTVMLEGNPVKRFTLLGVLNEPLETESNIEDTFEAENVAPI